MPWHWCRSNEVHRDVSSTTRICSWGPPVLAFIPHFFTQLVRMTRKDGYILILGPVQVYLERDVERDTVVLERPLYLLRIGALDPAGEGISSCSEETRGMQGVRHGPLSNFCASIDSLSSIVWETT